MSNFLRRAIPLCYTYDKTVREEYVSRAEDAVKMLYTLIGQYVTELRANGIICNHVGFLAGQNVSFRWTNMYQARYGKS